MIDFSVYFSGRNLGIFVRIAIESFMYHYPELKDSIYYFDDNSNDNTAEILSELGVQRITWSKFGHSDELNLVHRCDLVFKEILLHCETTYQLILDGDTITTSRNLLKLHELNPNTNIVNLYVTDFHNLSNTIEIPRQLARNYIEVGLLECENNKYRYARMSPAVILLNHTALGSYKEIIQTPDKNYLALLNGTTGDVASDLTMYILQNEIPYLNIYTKDSKYDSGITHLGWVSSSFADKDMNCYFSYDDLLENTVRKFLNPNVKTMLRILNINHRDVLNFYKDKIKYRK